MNAMDRMSCEYRTGYTHGLAHHVPNDYSGFNPVDEAYSGYGANPFADYDYRSGYRAGANDAWWHQFFAANGYRCAAPKYMPGACSDHCVVRP